MKFNALKITITKTMPITILIIITSFLIIIPASCSYSYISEKLQTKSTNEAVPMFLTPENIASGTGPTSIPGSFSDPTPDSTPYSASNPDPTSSTLTPSPSTTPSPTGADSYISELASTWNVPLKTDMIILVLSNKTTAAVQMYKKDKSGVWNKDELVAASGYVGKDGVGQAREGVDMTPKGMYTLTRAFGILSDPGTVLPYTKVDRSDYWVDDPKSKYYNKFVSTDNVKKDWASAEHLINFSPAYDYAIVIDYNLNCTPGAGSAFFLHCSTDSPTNGCVSVPKSDMLYILKNITANSVIIIL